MTTPQQGASELTREWEYLNFGCPGCGRHRLYPTTAPDANEWQCEKCERVYSLSTTAVAPAVAEPVANELDVLATYQGKDGRREWQSVGAWLYPGYVIAVVPDAAPPERTAQPTGANPTTNSPAIDSSLVVGASEAVAWVITLETGTRAVHLHNAIGDYRMLDPKATSTPLYTAQPNWREPLEALAALEKEMRASTELKRIGSCADVNYMTVDRWADELRTTIEALASQHGDGGTPK
jgi:predicted RNA-binding Zn-ribbon protein involved in translation (DUF1610 family)